MGLYVTTYTTTSGYIFQHVMNINIWLIFIKTKLELCSNTYNYNAFNYMEWMGPFIYAIICEHTLSRM
jgi:hypothetical protein